MLGTALCPGTLHTLWGRLCLAHGEEGPTGRTPAQGLGQPAVRTTREGAPRAWGLVVSNCPFSPPRGSPCVPAAQSQGHNGTESVFWSTGQLQRSHHFWSFLLPVPLLSISERTWKLSGCILFLSLRWGLRCSGKGICRPCRSYGFCICRVSPPGVLAVTGACALAGSRYELGRQRLSLVTRL